MKTPLDDYSNTYFYNILGMQFSAVTHWFKTKQNRHSSNGTVGTETFFIQTFSEPLTKIKTNLE